MRSGSSSVLLLLAKTSIHHCMKRNPVVVLCLLLGVVLVPRSLAEPVRVQTLQLQPGWNAVFLEVEPPDTAPDTVFANLPVDVVARYFPQTSPVQFISDPAETPWKGPSWGVWYAPTRDDAFLTTLHAIQGNKAYLVHATQACLWSVEGNVAFTRLRWQADSFNLTGFWVNPQTPPTFAAFFAGAQGLIGDRIYRLVDGRWQPVAAPGSTSMREGEACWVYCRGKTDYQGPLKVKAPGVEGLDFGAAANSLAIDLQNESSAPIRVTCELVAGSGGLPLAYAVKDLANLKTTYPPLDSAVSYPALEPGRPEVLQLQARREAMTSASQSTLLKISTDAGVQFWVPVRASRAAVANNP